ncbi:MAG TPA: hypothetical protein VD913_04610, partial [bacterium]|nr:hypothetical protein [bacterium]
MKPLFIKTVAILSAGTFIFCVPGYALRIKATQSSAILGELRSEIRAGATAYDYSGIRDSRLKELVNEQERTIGGVLNRDFKILFSGFDMNDAGKREVSALQQVFQTVPMHKYFEVAGKNPDWGVTIPEIKENPEEANKIVFP